MGHFIISCNFMCGHVCENHFQDTLIFRSPYKTVVLCDDVVRASGIETCNGLSVTRCAYRILCLIAVSPRIIHSDDRLHDFIKNFWRKSPYSLEISANFLIFEPELRLVGKRLYLTAAALPAYRARRIYAVRRWFYDFDCARKSVILLRKRDLSFYCIAHYRILNKEGIAVCTAYTLTIISIVFDFNDTSVVFCEFLFHIFTCMFYLTRLYFILCYINTVSMPQSPYNL